MDISPGPPFWRRIPDAMDIPLLDHQALSGWLRAFINGHVADALALGTTYSSVRSGGGFLWFCLYSCPSLLLAALFLSSLTRPSALGP